MKNILRCVIFAGVAFCASSAWAASSQTVNVNATVPTVTGGLSVTVSKVPTAGGSWIPATVISFGNLIWDTTNNIFLR
jgi:hypothetical protein